MLGLPAGCSQPEVLQACPAMPVPCTWCRNACHSRSLPHACSHRRASEIAAHTGLDERSAAAIEAFFGRSSAPTQPAAGLGGLPPQLHSL